MEAPLRLKYLVYLLSVVPRTIVRYSVTVWGELHKMCLLKLNRVQGAVINPTGTLRLPCTENNKS